MAPIPVTQPEIYYGEHSVSFVVVNSETEEFDYEPDEGNPIYKNYDGKGGIPLSSFLRRAVYAWQFGDLNILISNQLAPESRIQYLRTIQDRIHYVAPFLELDRDPLPGGGGWQAAVDTGCLHRVQPLSLRYALPGLIQLHPQ